MKMSPNHAGYKLMHDGCVALSQVETNGIRIDTRYLTETRKALYKRCDSMQKELMDTKVWRLWQKRFGSKASLGSGDQLGQVLYNDMGHKPVAYTDSGRASTDAHSLEKTKEPFVKIYLRWKKLSNANNTFLEGIERETCQGFLHPNYNLNLVISYRSSSDNPNFQNYPVRDPEIGELIRRCFIPRKGNVLVENDFKGVEVSIAACYNHDPNLIKYIKNPALDMHRDSAMECYFLEKEDVTKKIRYLGKNGFVFPEFYGDWYKSTTLYMWEGIEAFDLRGPGGIPMKEHLKNNGIFKRGKCDYDKEPEPGTFEKHMQEVERRFWKVRFRVYDKWKRDWYKDYLQKGYFDSYTGFRYEGIFDRKQTSNYPIQGSAFHCLLWSLIQTQREQNRKKAARLTVGQIHDSMLSDIPEREFDDHNALVKDVVENRLRKHWPWIIVPLTIETEITAPGKTWFDKKEVHVIDEGFKYNDQLITNRHDLFREMTKLKAA